MNIESRIKALEEEHAKKTFHLGVFQWSRRWNDEDPESQKRRRKAIVEEYITQGNPRPTFSVFITDPGERLSEDAQ